MKDKWHNWCSSHYLITKRGKCVSCVRCKGEIGKSSFQVQCPPAHILHAHLYCTPQRMQACTLTHRYSAPCWCFLVRCHYTIKRKPSGNRLSTTSCLLPRWQTSFCSCKLYQDFTRVNFLQKGWVGGKTKRQVCFGLQRSLVGWCPVQALLSPAGSQRDL